MSKEQLNEKAEGIVSNFLASSFVTNVKLVAKTGRTLVLILAPLAVAGYLYQTQADKVVLAIAIVLAIVGGLNLVKLAFNYEKLATGSKKRR